MSFRAWCLAAALGIAALAFIGMGAFYSLDSFSRYQIDHTSQLQEVAADQTGAASQGIDSCRAILNEDGVLSWLECVVKTLSSDSEETLSQYDLEAQQDMAAWAYGMFIATIWIAGITLLGVTFAGWTLVATRQMALDTRDIGEAQARAYVGLSRIDAESVIAALTERDQREISFGIKNFGQSPARQLRFLAVYNIHPRNIAPRDEDFIQAEGVEHPPDDTLQVGQEITGTARAYEGLSEKDYAAALDPLNVARLHIFGVITYADVFGREHKTRFGLYGKFDLDELEDGRSSVEPSFATLGFHNDAT